MTFQIEDIMSTTIVHATVDVINQKSSIDTCVSTGILLTNHVQQTFTVQSYR